MLSALTSYYMDRLGVIIDRHMIQNVMATTITESKHLITFGLVSHVMIFGVLPAVVILFVRIKPQSPLKTIAVPVATFVLSLALLVGLLLTDLKAYSSVLKERRDFMSSFQPGVPLVGAIRYATMMSQSVNVVVAPIGDDAAKGSTYARAQRPCSQLSLRVKRHGPRILA